MLVKGAQIGLYEMLATTSNSVVYSEHKGQLNSY